MDDVTSEEDVDVSSDDVDSADSSDDDNDAENVYGSASDEQDVANGVELASETDVKEKNGGNNKGEIKSQSDSSESWSNEQDSDNVSTPEVKEDTINKTGNIQEKEETDSDKNQSDDDSSGSEEDSSSDTNSKKVDTKEVDQSTNQSQDNNIHATLNLQSNKTLVTSDTERSQSKYQDQSEIQTANFTDATVDLKVNINKHGDPSTKVSDEEATTQEIVAHERQASTKDVDVEFTLPIRIDELVTDSPIKSSHTKENKQPSKGQSENSSETNLVQSSQDQNAVAKAVLKQDKGVETNTNFSKNSISGRHKKEAVNPCILKDASLTKEDLATPEEHAISVQDPSNKNEIEAVDTSLDVEEAKQGSASNLVIKMELKVWVDGIQRIICGVTEKTTCQDVVIALAHATGKTGRFVLLERWRDNERLMSPSDQPCQTLSKWGEYANEVQFVLRKSDSQTRSPSAQNTLLHNFSPPYRERASGRDSSIRKNTTFSGVHGRVLSPPSDIASKPGSRDSNHLQSPPPSDCSESSRSTDARYVDPSQSQGLDVMRGSGVGSRDQGFRRSLPKDVLKKWPHEQLPSSRNRPRYELPWVRTPHHQTNVSSDTELMSTSSPRARWLEHTRGAKSFDSNDPLREEDEPPLSKPSPSHHHHYPHRKHRQRGYAQDEASKAMSDSEGYGSHWRQEPESHAFSDNESYGNICDSDSNVPHQHPVLVSYNQVRHYGPRRTDSFKAALNIVNEDTVDSSSPVPSDLPERDRDQFPEGQDASAPNPEPQLDSREEEFRKKVADNMRYNDLIKLVHLQQQRISEQTSQINASDTEIHYWEGREKELRDQLSAIAGEIRQLDSVCNENQDYVDELEALGDLSEQVASLEQEGKAIREETETLQSNMSKMESQLKLVHDKISVLTERHDKESKEWEEVKQKKKQKELKELHEIARMQSEISKKLLAHEETVQEMETVSEQISELEAKIDEKSRECEAVLRDIRDENLETFAKADQPSETSEISEGEVSTSSTTKAPRKMTFAPQQLANVLPTPKNPHGMWV